MKKTKMICFILSAALLSGCAGQTSENESETEYSRDKEYISTDDETNLRAEETEEEPEYPTYVSVTVPNVKGMTLDSARKKIAESGLLCEVIEEENAYYENGIVFRQGTASNLKVEKGSTLVIYVAVSEDESKESEQPSYTSWDESESDESDTAGDTEDTYTTITPVTKPEPTAPEPTAPSKQTEPAPVVVPTTAKLVQPTTAKPAEPTAPVRPTTTELVEETTEEEPTFDENTPRVTVPDIRGYEINDSKTGENIKFADEVIKECGLVPVIKYYYNKDDPYNDLYSCPDCLLLDVEPKQGSEVPLGSKVTLTLTGGTKAENKTISRDLKYTSVDENVGKDIWRYSTYLNTYIRTTDVVPSVLYIVFSIKPAVSFKIKNPYFNAKLEYNGTKVKNATCCLYKFPATYATYKDKEYEKYILTPDFELEAGKNYYFCIMKPVAEYMPVNQFKLSGGISVEYGGQEKNLPFEFSMTFDKY